MLHWIKHILCKKMYTYVYINIMNITNSILCYIDSNISYIVYLNTETNYLYYQLSMLWCICRKKHLYTYHMNDVLNKTLRIVIICHTWNVSYCMLYLRYHIIYDVLYIKHIIFYICIHTYVQHNFLYIIIYVISCIVYCHIFCIMYCILP